MYKTEKEKALQLRGEGKSYQEIQRAVGVRSKSTLTLWFKNIKLTSNVQKIIDARRARTEKNILLWSKERSRKIGVENQEIIQTHTKYIGKISERDLLLIGVALYWGEGSLRRARGQYGYMKFSNSNPEMVKVFMRFVREILEISDEAIHPHVQIYPNLNPIEVMAFWAKTTQLSITKFKAYIQVSSASKRKRPGNFLPYGTVQIRINGRKNFYKIRGYIDGIIKGTT